MHIVSLAQLVVQHELKVHIISLAQLVVQHELKVHIMNKQCSLRTEQRLRGRKETQVIVVLNRSAKHSKVQALGLLVSVS